MYYASILDQLACHLSSISRVCSRYNSPVITDKFSVEKTKSIDVAHRSTKLVVVDYPKSDLSFTLKIMQAEAGSSTLIAQDALLALHEKILSLAAESDATFKSFTNVVDALKHSGINSSYLRPLRDIYDTLSAHAGDDDFQCRYVASSNFANPYVGIVFQHGWKVFFLQFME